VRLACAWFVLWSATALAGPGRVVRVERTAGNQSLAPRICDLRAESGTCLGDEPRPGQTVAILDERRVVAEVQILEATSFVTSCANLWTVRVHAPRGTSWGDGVGVIDPALHPSRARIVDKSHIAAPSGVPGEEVVRAIDRDGDGTADLLITRYGCDSSGRPTAGVTTFCIEVWTRSQNRMMRRSQINLAQCSL
jgi:hypothetical protein